MANPELLDDPFGKERAMARFATVNFAVDEVLGSSKFTPVARTVPVEVYLHREDVLQDLQKNLPDGRAVLILRNKGEEDDPSFFRLVNDSQGLIREFEGLAHLAAESGPFFDRLEGRPFGLVVDELRAARSE